MEVTVRRAVVPALLLIGGLAALLYGAMFHSAPVLEERETKTTIEVPAPLPPPPLGENRPGAEPGLPGEGPLGGLPFVQQTVTRTDQVTLVESEPALMREVSVGGVVLLPSGQLKRTYSGDKGPALCPS
jgi:hypothetical protein